MNKSHQKVRQYFFLYPIGVVHQQGRSTPTYSLPSVQPPSAPTSSKNPNPRHRPEMCYRYHYQCVMCKHNFEDYCFCYNDDLYCGCYGFVDHLLNKLYTRRKTCTTQQKKNYVLPVCASCKGEVNLRVSWENISCIPKNKWLVPRKLSIQ
jgi:hypothetical protein